MTVRSAPSAGPAPPPPLTLWERVSFTAVHAAAWALLVSLGLEGLYRFGRLFGTLEWLINFKRRRRFHRALARVLPDPPSPARRRSITRAYFAQSRCDKLFYLVFDRLSAEEAASRLRIVGRELLDGALARGRGAYIAFSHHGAHHVLAMLMSLKGYRTAGVRDRKESGLRRYVQDRFDRRYPDRKRMRVLYADSYPREIYRCFEQGYLLGSAIDVNRLRSENQKVEWVEVFGERRPFLIGPIRVALRCGAPVLQGFILPEGAFRYRLEIVEMLVDPDRVPPGKEEEAARQAVHRYAAHLERYVRETPSLLTRI
ncbi:MAG: hypothetical protein D6788_11230 [Planctomycetota bacterium]|nr:MAG: hypothetical protein D6788_11230 [Planctomycetota bacterium]